MAQCHRRDSGMPQKVDVAVRRRACHSGAFPFTSRAQDTILRAAGHNTTHRTVLQLTQTHFTSLP